jgi:DNA-binding SARP family transcriptional activator
VSAASLDVKLFGSLELRRSDGVPLALPSKVARSLLAYLLTHRERAHARERLAGIFWPNSSHAVVSVKRSGGSVKRWARIA